MLAFLVAHANDPIGTDRLIEELWPERRPEHAAKAVQIYVSRLRAHIGRERILTTSAGYLLRTEPDEIDAVAFERLAEDGRERLEAGESDVAEVLLSEALSLWRGQAYADFRFDDFAQAEIRRLEELRRQAVTDRIEARLRLGRAEEVVGELELLMREQPLWERPRGQLMTALYQMGRQADALALYRRTRDLLAAELGLEPGPELQSLERAILNQASELERPTSRRQMNEREPRRSARGAFVGRRAELDRLRAGLDDAVAGRGRIFLLVGEPGIGKSRLADELTRSARERGASVLIGRCWEAGGAPAFWPWVQSLRVLVKQSEPASLRSALGPDAADLAQILPELRDRFPELPAPTVTDSSAARFRLFGAAAEFLRNASNIRPLVLVLDDLHAADTPSLLLLRFLAREIAESRILLLGACRDVDPVPTVALAEAIAEIVREPGAERLTLGVLSQADVAEYVDRTAAELRSPALIAALHARTDGNPLFLTETMRLLAMEGDGSAAAGTVFVIPQGVRDVILRRLAGLTDKCNRVLELASVLGREFLPSTVAALAGTPDDALLEILDEAVAARVVTDVPGTAGRLRFAHVLVRDSVYETMARTRRIRLHRQALAVLARLYGDEPGPHLAELAHHAIAGGDVEQGLRYAQRAGDQAVALLAYEEAVRLYSLALDSLPDAPLPRSEAELLLALGHAQSRAGEAVEAKVSYLRAAEVAGAARLPDAFARAALGYGGRFVWARAGDDVHVVPLLRQALELTAGADASLSARLTARLAAALGDEPDPGERERLSRDAVEMARSAGEASTLAYTLVARLSAIWSPAHAEERLALASELVALSTENADRERAVEAYGLRSNTLMELGAVEAADADLVARGRLTEEMHQPAQRWVQLLMETTRCIFRGDFEDAETMLQGTFELRASRGGGARAALELQRFILRRERGGLEDLESDLAGSAEADSKRRVLRCALANLSVELGRLDEAGRRLRQLAADDFAAVPLDGDWLVSAALLAETCRAVGDGAASASLYARLLPFAERNVCGEGEASTGAVARYLGQLASAKGDVGEAVDRFEYALGENERMGARPWLAHTRQDLGALLLVTGRTADRGRAHDLLRAALTTYRQLGMYPYAARLEEGVL